MVTPDPKLYTFAEPPGQKVLLWLTEIVPVKVVCFASRIPAFMNSVLVQKLPCHNFPHLFSYLSETLLWSGRTVVNRPQWWGEASDFGADSLFFIDHCVLGSKQAWLQDIWRSGPWTPVFNFWPTRKINQNSRDFKHIPVLCLFVLGVLFVCFSFGPHSEAFRVLVPRPGIEPGPLQWKSWVLTTGLPGNSQHVSVCPLCFSRKWHLKDVINIIDERAGLKKTNVVIIFDKIRWA